MTRPRGGGMGSWAALKTGKSLDDFLSVCAAAGMSAVEIGLFADHGDFDQLVNGDWIRQTGVLLEGHNLDCVALATEFPGGPLALTGDHDAFLAGVEAFSAKLAGWDGGPKDVRVDTKTFPEHFTSGVVNPGHIPGTPQSPMIGYDDGVKGIMTAMKAAVGIASSHGVTLHCEIEPGFAPSSYEFALSMAKKTGLKIMVDFCHAYAAWVKCMRQIKGHSQAVADLSEAFQGLRGHVEWIHVCGGNGRMCDLGGGLVTTDHLAVDDPQSAYDCEEVTRLAAQNFPQARILDVDYCGFDGWEEGASAAQQFCAKVLKYWD